MAQVNKIDSNYTGLYYAEETSIGTLPTSPTWYSLEPNSYADFGSQFTLTPRVPISDSRQRRKGQITDESATAGFNHDFTTLGMKNLLQGFFFADADDQRRISDIETVNSTLDAYFPTGSASATSLPIHAKPSTAASSGYVVGDTVTVTDPNGSETAQFVVLTLGTSGEVTGLGLDPSFTYAPFEANSLVGDLRGLVAAGGSGTGLVVDVRLLVSVAGGPSNLLLAEGFGSAKNNGLKTVDATSTGFVIDVVGELDQENSPPSGAALIHVGRNFAGSGVVVTEGGAGLPTATFLGYNMTYVVSPGSYVYLDGHVPANNGLKRVYSVAYNEATDTSTLTFDKSDLAMVTDTPSAATSIYFGDDLYNKTGSQIKRRTYSLERSLGAPDDANPTQIQYQYLDGQVPNSLTFNFSSASKLEVDMGFVGLTGSTAAAGVSNRRPGTFVTSSFGSAYNTADHPYRVKLSTVSATNVAVAPLFAFVMDGTIEIDNGANTNKALGSRGGFEVSVGDFTVGGQLNAYFSDVDAIEAIATNADITLDIGVKFDNKGIVLDLPLLALGDGRPNVTKDEPIMIPVSTEAARGFEVNQNLDYTLRMVFFNYLP